MKPMIRPGLLLSQIKATVLSVVITCVNTLHSNDQIFNKCFSQDYSFTCDDSKDFMQKMGIEDIDKNIISMESLYQTKKLKMGASKGTFHADQNYTEYFVKECSLVHEFLGSRLINLIMGTSVTPIVKIIKDKKNGAASAKLPYFVRYKDINLENQTIIGEVNMVIALDYLGIRDRNPKNTGFVIKPFKGIRSARVDFDTSLRFKNHRWKPWQDENEHLNLFLLHESLNQFPKDKVIKGIQKIVKVPNKKIVMTVLECCHTLDEMGYNISFERSIELAQQLMERKKAFAKVLKKLSAPTDLPKPKKTQKSKSEL